MVNKCSGFGCKSGYKSNKQVESLGPRLTFHSFPINNKPLCEKWLRANPRKDFIPSKHSKLCSLHFKPTDFVEERQDTDTARVKRKSKKLIQRYLTADAVPSIFENCPKYLSNSDSAPRTTVLATSSSRFEQQSRELDILEQSFLADDDISDLTLLELSKKLKMETAMPSGFTITVQEDLLFIYLLDIGERKIPKIKASITITSEMKVIASSQSKEIPSSQFNDLFKGTIQHMSQLINLMARVKSLCEDSATVPLKLNISFATQMLQSALDNMDDTESEEFRKISFIIEQLKLVSKKKYGRHYSPQLTIMSFKISAASSSAYNALLEENVLSLPSNSTLKKISKRLNGDTGLDNVGYLKLRISKLNEFQRNVSLIIDEIYVAN